MEAAIDWHPIAVITVLMVLDILTGFGGAAKDSTVESGKMREGLWHKAGFYGLVALAAVWEVGSVWLNAEVSGIGVSVPQIPAVGAVCTFVAATEVVSILENLCVLNPDIAELPVIKRLKPHDPEKAAEKTGADDWKTVVTEDDDDWGYSPMYDGENEKGEAR